MNGNAEAVATMSAEEKRALLAELLRKKNQTSKTCPVSFAQQRLWFLDQLEPGSAFYNIPTAVRLSGQLDIHALAQGLNEIVRRHESLRTTFKSVDGKPVQVIAPSLKIAMPVIDLSGTIERDAEAHRLAKEEIERPFDLQRGPLLRVQLLRLAETEHVAVLTMHHIIADGWSMDVLIQELTTLYVAFSSGEPSPLPELPIQYGDYARWQRRRMTDELVAAQMAYWQRQLQGAPTVLQLPADRPSPSVRTNRGAQYAFPLARPLTEAIQSLSREENATPYMTLLAAFYALLSRYTGQQDMLIGTPVAGRSRTETEALIGFFVNTLVLRGTLDGKMPFRELLRKVRETTLDAHMHQDVPFEMLVEELQPERSLSQTPLFQVMFALLKSGADGTELPGLTIGQFALEGNTSKFDLMLTMEESQYGLNGLFEYSTDLFDAATIERMALHFQTLLNAIIAQPDTHLEDLPLLTERERHQALVEWNETGRSFPQESLLHELFEEQAARTPQAVAVMHGDERLSYAELNARANQLAHHLRRQGIGPDSLVGMMVERSTEMMVGVLGVLKAGGAYVPLDPQYPQDRLSFMLEDSGLKLLLTQADLRGQLPENISQVIALDANWPDIALESEQNLTRCATPANLAYVLYTSGSTGRPKGVAMPHRPLVNLLAWQLGEPSFKQGARTLQFASLNFDVSFQEIFSTWLSGGTLALVDDAVRRDAIALWDMLAEYEVERLFLPFIALQHMVEINRGRTLPARLREIITAGEQLQVTPALVELFERLEDCTLQNQYGPTEAHVVSAFTLKGKAADWPTLPPIGQPIANTQIYLLDANLQPVPVGVAGELYIGGAALARNYLNRAELTAEKFICDPLGRQEGGRLYRTGDIARHLPGGEIEYLGRIDQQVKVRGFRIEPGEIEAALQEQAGVGEAVVVAQAEASGEGQRLVAYVVAAGGAREGTAQQELDITGMRHELEQRLPHYMVPSLFIILESLPRTPSGKIDRRALPAPDAGQLSRATEFVAPRTVFEEMLAAIWQTVLKVERVGLDDNFFQLGGHSLLATQVISRVRETFSVEMGVRKLFEHPTLGGLAASIEDAVGERRELQKTPLVPVGRERDLPLSFAQQRLWFLAQLEPESAAYNIPLAVRLTGQLDIAVLEQTLTAVVSRHETLRTTFTVIEGQAVQRISPAAPVSLKVSDLRSQPEGKREEEARHLAMLEAQHHFDLTREVLRLKLLRLRDDEHIILVTMHHIISDGWSQAVLVREVAAHYTSLMEGASSPMPELEIQYADFAHWQRQWLTGETLEAQLAYWREQLKQAPAGLEFLTDKPRPAVQTFNGADEAVEIPAALTAALKELSRREGSTLFMTLLAAFQTLLYRYTGQEDILVGTPIANRTREELEPLIGFFVNTLVLRASLAGDPKFRDLLRQVREMALGAYAHQDVPFELLVEELQPVRDMSRTPFFQVMMVMQNAPEEILELPGLQLSQYATQGTTAKYELTLIVEEHDGRLYSSLEYNTDLFEAQTIRQLLGHFQRLLASIAADPEQRLSQLVMLDEAERRHLLSGGNSGTGEFAQTSLQCLHTLFEAQAKRAPDSIALVDEHGQLTYGELNGRANQLAYRLMKLGVKSEGMVGILMERSMEMIVSILAVLKAGAAYVPLDPQYPHDRLSFMLSDSQAPVLLTQSRLADEALSHNVEHVVFVDADWESISQESTQDCRTQMEPEQLAYLIYTSGSTGTPKGVAVTHSNVARLLSSTQQWFGFDEQDVWTLFHSYAFDFSVWELWGALAYGGKLVVVSYEVSRDAERFYRLLAAEAVTVLNQTPSAFRQLTRVVETQRAAQALSLRYVIFGGEALELHSLKPWFDRYGDSSPQLINMYGITETTVHVTYRPLSISDLAHTGRSPIGVPIPDLQVYVLDRRMEPVPVGVAGEMYVGGEGLARNYLNRPELTAERFVADPFDTHGGGRLYRTGDLARFLHGGELDYLGRIDQQVKVRGFRIELGEIEAALQEQAGVGEAVVVAQAEASGEGQRLVAYVVAAATGRQDASGLVQEPERAQLDVGLLRRELEQRLPQYMLPSMFVLMDELPLTPNGKIDRKALPVGERAAVVVGTEYIAPRDLLELDVARIWEEVLGLNSVGVKSNFFELGGHSLLAVRLFAQIEQKFGVKLPLASLFRSPTVEQLADQLRQRSTVVTGSNLVEIRQGNFAPPVFFVHPIGGNVLCYAELARHLDLAQPFYGLQAEGLDGEREPLRRIESMAAHYIKMLRGVQPAGPYILGGWSMGGVIAYEMAQQLLRQGQQTSLLAMLDSYAPVAEDAASLEEDNAETLLARFALDVGLAPDIISRSRTEMAGLSPDERLAVVLEQAKAAGFVHRDVSLSRVRELYRIFKINNRALKRYTPQAYTGNVVLFKAAEEARATHSDSTSGWGSLVTGGLDISEVSGDHYTMMRAPHVSVLAGQLKSYLNKTNRA